MLPREQRDVISWNETCGCRPKRSCSRPQPKAHAQGLHRTGSSRLAVERKEITLTIASTIPHAARSVLRRRMTLASFVAVLLPLAALPPAARAQARAQSSKLALAPPADYKNRYEVYGGIGFQNGQAGQALPRRFNQGTAEALATYWLTPHLGVAADYRFAGGTTPVLSPYYNRVAIYDHIFMGGVQWRGPKNRYAAIDYHGLAGVAHGIFDTAIRGYPGGSPVSAESIGLYSNQTSPYFALGGSVDFNYTKNIAIRLQPDLILEHFGTETREFFAISAGVVYRFGHR